MSRHPARRPDPGIKSADSVMSQPQSPPQAEGAETTTTAPEDLDRGWIVVQWLWPLCFLVLLASEVGLFLFRKAVQ